MPDLGDLWVDRVNGRIARVFRTFRGRQRNEVDVIYVRWGNQLRLTLQEFHERFTYQEVP